LCSFLLKPLLKLAYRVEVKGLENFAAAGQRVLIVANHTSFLDVLLISAFLPERVTFALNGNFAQRWWLKLLLRAIDVFPLDFTDPLSTEALIEMLKQNRKCMIFPEGRLTSTGALMKVYEGPGLIADKSNAMILPIRIDGAQYTPFSHLKGKVRIRFFPKITLTIMPPRHFSIPENVISRERRQLAATQLYDLMAEMMLASSPVDSTLFKSLLEARRIHGGCHKIIEDQKREPMSYRKLIMKSIMMSRLIKRATPVGEKITGLMHPTMTETVVAFFAIQALGRVTAMINFTAGPTQVLSACRAAKIKTIITSERFVTNVKLMPVVEHLRQAGVRVIFLEELQASLRLTDKLTGLLAAFMPGLLVKRATNKIKPNDPAILFFTSGSEGAPKGVMLSHRNILANCYQVVSQVSVGPQDIMFNALPIFHSFGMTCGTFVPIFWGLKTFLYPSPLHYNAVAELIYSTDATITFASDTFLANYARVAHPYDFYNLHYVIAGAEKLKDETRRIWAEKFGIRVLEGYGVTEASPVISIGTPMHCRIGTVGRLLPGIQARLNPVPGIETGGSLVVKGPNVMLGYIKEDAPGVLQPPADGWYDTGDVATIDEDGYVTIVGRIKRFAKIGGEMVSLVVVETTIASNWPNSRHAVVSIPDTRKGEMIVLLTEDPSLELDALPEIFRKHGLTELSLPRRLIRLKELPLLGNGKMNYVKAKAMAVEQFASS